MTYKSILKIIAAIGIFFLHFVVGSYAILLIHLFGVNVDETITLWIYYAILLVLSIAMVVVMAREKTSVTALNYIIILVLLAKWSLVVIDDEIGIQRPYVKVLREVT